jgi:hypothetical protein
VHDLGQLRSVQRPVGEDAKHARLRELGADGIGVEPKPGKGGVTSVTVSMNWTGDPDPAGPGVPGFVDREDGNGCPLEIGEDQRNPLAKVEPIEHSGWNFQLDRYRPSRPISEFACACDRIQIASTEKAGQRRISSREQKLQIGELSR